MDFKTPWVAQSRSLSDGALVIKNAAFEQVCVIAEKADRSYKKDAEHLPIASLIEAAPDMLAALERIASDQTVFELDEEDEGWDVESLASWHEANVNAARAAIAKAKGS